MARGRRRGSMWAVDIQIGEMMVGAPPDRSGVAIEVGHSRHAILGESDVISWRERDIVEVGHFKLLAVDVKWV